MIILLCLFSSTIFTKNVYDQNTAKILLQTYTECMKKQDSTIASGENCINDYTNGLTNNKIVSAEQARARKLEAIDSYQCALEECRICEKNAENNQDKKSQCYSEHIGLTGFHILTKAHLTPDQLTQESYTTRFGLINCNLSEKKIRQNLFDRLHRCYSRAGDNETSRQQCHDNYKRSMQASGFNLEEENKGLQAGINPADASEDRKARQQIANQKKSAWFWYW
jgi:hypothetical protein